MSRSVSAPANRREAKLKADAPGYVDVAKKGMTRALYQGSVEARGRMEPDKATPRPDRNSPCPCGAPVKFKRCCGRPK